MTCGDLSPTSQNFRIFSVSTSLIVLIEPYGVVFNNSTGFFGSNPTFTLSLLNNAEKNQPSRVEVGKLASTFVLLL